MKNNVMISLKSINITDGESNQTELVTQATFSKSGKYDIITYEDTEATGFEGSTTTIKADGSREVCIIREGSTNSMLSLEVGRKHFCNYGTPYGGMQFGVYTHAIDNKIAENGSLYLKYSLDVNADLLSDNEIIINIQ